MQTSASIDHLSEVIADEGLFPARMGHRDPRSPSFVFFDDDKEIDPEVQAFREDLLAFEEWNATNDRNDDSEVQVGMFTVKRSSRAWDDSKEEAPFQVCEYSNLKELVDDRYNRDHPRYDDKGVLLNPYLGVEPVITKRTHLTYSELQTVQERANWLVGFYKRQMPNNDKWHRIIKALGLAMSDEDMDLAVNPVVELKKALKGGFRLKDEGPEESTLPGVVVNPLSSRKRYAKMGVRYAPGPVGGTTFVNKTLENVQHTKGTNPISAKSGFAKNHGLTDEFVSVDRVQYEGQKESRYVVGRRRTSDTTPSNYYDPEPAWKDKEGGTYAPRACALFYVETDHASYFKNVHLEGIHPDIPEGAYRLTVREFERALVAGAECYDDADEAFAGLVESDYSTEGGSYYEEDDSDTRDIERIYDGRVSLMNYGYGGKGRDTSSFTEEEDYLYGILRMVGDAQGQELIALADQDTNMIHRHVMSCGTYDGVVSILKFVQKDNPEMLEFVTKALCGDEDLHEEPNVLDMEAVPPLWETDYSVPTGPGSSRLAQWTKWKD